MVRHVVTWALAVGVACAPPPSPRCSSDDTAPVIEGATWHRDVAPIIAGRCAGCHVDGGIAPMPLATLEDVRAFGDLVDLDVTTRRMPPWMPAPCCNAFQHDPSLSPSQIATVHGWFLAGMPEGDPLDVGAPLPSAVALRVDTTVAMEDAYMPDVARSDDVRCFALDWPVDELRFITGFAIHPGMRAQVHHALVVVASGAERELARDLDARDDELGWSCPGGALLGFSDFVGLWMPGSAGEQMPEGTGHRVDADDLVILSVHYSKPHAGGVAVEPDQTTVDFMLDDSVEDELFTMPLMDPKWPLGGMPIARDTADVRHAVELDALGMFGINAPVEIIGGNLHMHERGVSGQVALIHDSGARECLLQHDDYDFAWHGNYLFALPMTLLPGERVSLECVFDNTASHQRLVDGVPEASRDLNWGDDQEMCVAFLIAKRP